jgi:hypothetical protein
MGTPRLDYERRASARVVKVIASEEVGERPAERLIETSKAMHAQGAHDEVRGKS